MDTEVSHKAKLLPGNVRQNLKEIKKEVAVYKLTTACKNKKVA